jgi:hypothetical protein
VSAPKNKMDACLIAMHELEPPFSVNAVVDFAIKKHGNIKSIFGQGICRQDVLNALMYSDGFQRCPDGMIRYRGKSREDQADD